MFVSQSKKGAAIFNGLILFAIVVVAVAVVSALTKIKPDPKNVGGFVNTLSLKKK